MKYWLSKAIKHALETLDFTILLVHSIDLFRKQAQMGV